MFTCERCGYSESLPDLPDEARAEVAALKRAGDPMRVIKRLRDEGVSLTGAKVVMLHLTLARGQCHWCGRELGESSRCSKCRSTNLDW
jgi:predicted Zn-ribbon and HTH transcriptional regulator